MAIGWVTTVTLFFKRPPVAPLTEGGLKNPLSAKKAAKQAINTTVKEKVAMPPFLPSNREKGVRQAGMRVSF